MRFFVRQSLKGGRICAFSQYYISKFCNDLLRIISEELYVEGKIHILIEA